MKIKNKILFVLIPILAISCDKKRVFDQYKSVENTWHKDSVISFDLPKLEPTKSFNLFVNIRDNNKTIQYSVNLETGELENKN